MTNNNLATQLKQIGLRAVPTQMDDFIARATKARWSPLQILEELSRAETAERSRRSLERRLRISGIKRFKPMADFDWSWPWIFWAKPAISSWWAAMVWARP
jgi:DNA replication protein DnaC